MAKKANRSSRVDDSAAADALLPPPADPSESFLEQKAQWRAAAREGASSSISVEDFQGWYRGDTSSEAFRPSRYGLKK